MDVLTQICPNKVSWVSKVYFLSPSWKIDSNNRSSFGNSFSIFLDSRTRVQILGLVHKLFPDRAQFENKQLFSGFPGSCSGSWARAQILGPRSRMGLNGARWAARWGQICSDSDLLPNMARHGSPWIRLMEFQLDSASPGTELFKQSFITFKN